MRHLDYLSPRSPFSGSISLHLEVGHLGSVSQSESLPQEEDQGERDQSQGEGKEELGRQVSLALTQARMDRKMKAPTTSHSSCGTIPAE